MTNHDVQSHAPREALRGALARFGARLGACALIAGAVPVVAAPSSASLSVSAEASRLRHQLELFIPLAPGDSVVALRGVEPDTLEAAIVSPQGVSRTARFQATPMVRSRLLESGMFLRSDAISSSTSSAPVPLTSSSARQEYMSGQMTAAIGVYGLGLVSALQLEGQSVILIPSLAVTTSLIAHSVYSLNHPMNDAQVLGMNYVSGAAILSSYALGYAALGSDADAFRLGAGLSLLAYPASLWPGHVYGSSFQDKPWVLSKKVVGSGVGAAVGVALPWVYFEDAGTDIHLRTSALQFLAFGLAGNFAADAYRPGEKITDGTATGIFLHTTLASLAGVALLSTVNPEDSRVGTALLLGPALAGFGEGLWFFRDRNDGADLASYSGLGMGGGLLVSGAIALTAGMELSTALWFMTASGMAAYAVVYRGMESRSRDAAGDGVRHDRTAALELVPVVERIRVADLRTGRETFDVRYRVPGLVVRF